MTTCSENLINFVEYVGQEMLYVTSITNESQFYFKSIQKKGTKKEIWD